MSQRSELKNDTASYSGNEGSNARQHQRRSTEVFGSTLLVCVGSTSGTVRGTRLGA